MKFPLLLMEGGGLKRCITYCNTTVNIWRLYICHVKENKISLQSKIYIKKIYVIPAFKLGITAVYTQP